MLANIKLTAVLAVLVIALAGFAVFAAESNQSDAIGEDLSGTLMKTPVAVRTISTTSATLNSTN